MLKSKTELIFSSSKRALNEVGTQRKLTLDCAPSHTAVKGNKLVRQGSSRPFIGAGPGETGPRNGGEDHHVTFYFQLAYFWYLFLEPRYCLSETILILTLVVRIDSKLHHQWNDSDNGVLDEDSLRDFLWNEYEQTESKACNIVTKKEWEHLVDIDNEWKADASIKATLESAKLDKMYWEKYFRNLNPSNFKDINLRRQIVKLSRLGNSALDDDELAKLTNITNKMTEIYSTAKVCPPDFPECNLDEEGLPLEPDLINIMAKPGLFEDHQYIWKEWHQASGANMKELFRQYVELSNKAARANGFHDKGAMWRSEYECENFEEDMKNLWMQVRPLYNELHKYVLNSLMKKFDEEIMTNETLIPAHVLGNMWAQSWLNIAPLVMPFPNETKLDATELFREHNWTVLKMFETADDFYQSLGLESNEMSYNVSGGALIVKPEDRNVVCHASAWDFCDRKDFRIKMCTELNFESFVVIHHEMGHIQYYQLYKYQPYAYRTGANPGFHEAIGDTIALSVSTPSHLYSIGLLNDLRTTEKASINSLMNMALERIAFLPFGYLVDRWRWDVFRGDVSYAGWNRHWWHYRSLHNTNSKSRSIPFRETIQKIKAPVERNDEYDFDPGAKFHVASDSQYISYFFAHILEFQLHRALCIAAGEYNPKKPKKKPLHMCDIYKSKAAGKRLRRGLLLGASVHWKKVLQKITGETTLSARAILEYFQPLFAYLIQENQKTDQVVQQDT
ncbi:angiotensin-converting enzyme [Holotrichia oblita]|uniref:Angiotensin-converting enzyme n=1 Tax=Holotrichia oblita TaxID=644536 RepID=A0ACB9T1M4_HOLOL|nr:angiotensin-converting enzyme [Holotrichia oblita]